jgi:hypothetical protein
MMLKLMKTGIDSLKFHLNRPSNQFDPTLLSRMLNVARYYPAFSNQQKAEFEGDAVIF